MDRNALQISLGEVRGQLFILFKSPKIKAIKKKIMAQTTPRVQAEEGGTLPQHGSNGGTATGIAAVHRRACLRRRAVAVSWSEMEAEEHPKRGESAGEAAASLGGNNAHRYADNNNNNSSRQTNLAELRRELLHDATYVRTDGTVMPPVVVSSLNDDGGCGSTESSSPAYSSNANCELLILERPSVGNDGNGTAQNQQHEAVARHVCRALVRSLKSTPLGGVVGSSSRHGAASASARSTGGAVTENRHSAGASNADTTSPDDTTAAAMSTPRKIIGSLGTMAWGLAQIVSPVLTTSNVERYDGMEDEDILEQCATADECEDDAAGGSSGRHLLLDDDRDIICHVGLMVDCIRLILSYASTELDGQDAKLLYRFEKGPQSLAEFCRLAASASLSATVEKSADYMALCKTLSGLSPVDLELLLLAMVSAGYAMLSSDGDVVALLPKHSAGANAESAVDEVNLAIFRLQSTVAALERRIEHLSEQADAAQARAVSAKKKRQSNLAVTYLKLRNLRRAEIDRASASLLNVEQSLQTLQRTRADAEVVKAYKLAGDAMKMARKSEEEGGLGLNADNVEAMTDELAELTEEINETSAMLENAGIHNGVGEFSEEELLRELDTLEDVDDLANALASTGIEDEGNAEGAAKVETKDLEKVGEKNAVEKEAVGEGDCAGMKKEAVAS